MSDELKKLRDSLQQIDYALDNIVYMLAAARLAIRRLESEGAQGGTATAQKITKP